MTGAAIVGAGGLASCMTGQPAARGAGTTPKPLALYQDVPNKGRRCAGCTHFLEPNACDIVAGEISPDWLVPLSRTKTGLISRKPAAREPTLDLIEEITQSQQIAYSTCDRQSTSNIAGHPTQPILIPFPAVILITTSWWDIAMGKVGPSFARTCSTTSRKEAG